MRIWPRVTCGSFRLIAATKFTGCSSWALNPDTWINNAVPSARLTSLANRAVDSHARVWDARATSTDLILGTIPSAASVLAQAIYTLLTGATINASTTSDAAPFAAELVFGAIDFKAWVYDTLVALADLIIGTQGQIVAIIRYASPIRVSTD